ncbi:TIGR02677 family protein [Robertmurraya kyonggiensis]|uniref:TIGR02677 family protein n=1 Tax=Robertmurraya kyonggiensis TaxID=1037680 RepID=UPI00130E4162|nr:TIGR02677 family protein [Robertmurraya kyonggiensis]
MNIEQRLIKPLTLAKYLSEGNYQHYIAIINYLYEQRVVYYAPPALPTAILENILKNDSIGLFENYNLAKLEDDLKRLEEWGNVLAHPDTGHATRIEDFNKRKLRYECTEETIELERMLERMNSQISKVNGSMDPELVNSLAALLLELERFKVKDIFTIEDGVRIGQLWDQILEGFEKLRRDSSDYLGVINSKNIDEAMQNKEVSVFRRRFTDYLTDFIMSIQRNIYGIEVSIREINRSLLEKVIARLIQIQKDKPTLDEPLSDEEYREIFFNQWNGLRKWFVYDEFNERYVDYLLKQTSDTISRFTKYLEQISERNRLVKNRKKDFEHIARLFKEENDFELCKKSFGAMTNVEKPLYFNSDKKREVNPEEPLYEHIPEMIGLKTARDVVTQRVKKQVSVKMSQEDLEELKKIEDTKRYEESMVLELISRGKVTLSELRNVEPFMRSNILQWIQYCNGRKEMKGKTEQGVNYRISKKSASSIKMHCVDGTLEMPDYVFEFEV